MKNINKQITVGIIVLIGIIIWGYNSRTTYPKPYTEKMRFQEYYNDTLVIVDYYTYGKIEKRINDNDVQWGENYSTSLKWMKMMCDKTYNSPANTIGVKAMKFIPDIIDEALNPILINNQLSGITIDSMKVITVVTSLTQE